MSETSYTIEPIGFIRSELTDLEAAPRQGDEGAPAAWLELTPAMAPGLAGIKVGDELIVLSWLPVATSHECGLCRLRLFASQYGREASRGVPVVHLVLRDRGRLEIGALAVLQSSHDAAVPKIVISHEFAPVRPPEFRAPTDQGVAQALEPLLPVCRPQ